MFYPSSTKIAEVCGDLFFLLAIELRATPNGNSINDLYVLGGRNLALSVLRNATLPAVRAGSHRKRKLCVSGKTPS